MHVIYVKPPLTIIHVGNGCEAYSSNLFIPAKSELTSKDNAVVRHTYFQQFNEDYQNITRYSLIEDLGLIKLTKKEIENLPDCLTALPNLQFKEKETSRNQETIQHTFKHLFHSCCGRRTNSMSYCSLCHVVNIQGTLQG